MRTLLALGSNTAAPSRQPTTTCGELVDIRRISAGNACSAKMNTQPSKASPCQSLQPRHSSVRHENPCACHHKSTSSPALMSLRHAPFPGATVVSSMYPGPPLRRPDRVTPSALRAATVHSQNSNMVPDAHPNMACRPARLDTAPATSEPSP